MPGIRSASASLLALPGGRVSRDTWPSAVLFDLDGTLADSFVGIHAALAQALVEFGFPTRDLDWVRRHVGRGARPLLVDAMGRNDEDLVLRVGERFGALYWETFLDATPARPDAAGLLSLAHDNTGGRVAVVSNKAERLCRTWLEYVGLAGWVRLVAGPDTFGACKPDPAAVLPVLGALGVAADEALLIGDMPIDAVTADNSGMAALLVRGGAADEDELRVARPLAVLAGLDEVAAWLLEHGRGWGYHTHPGRRLGG